VSERVSEKERESEREEAGGEKDEMASIAIGGVAQAGAVIGAAALMNATRPRDEVEVITGMRSNMGWLARKSNSGATVSLRATAARFVSAAASISTQRCVARFCRC